MNLSLKLGAPLDASAALPRMLGRQSNASTTNCTALDNVRADHTLLMIVIPTEEGHFANEGHHAGLRVLRESVRCGWSALLPRTA